MNANRAIYLLAFVVGFVMLSCTMQSRADDVGVWLTTGEWSAHDNEGTHHYRQNNTGFGLELDVSPDTSYFIGHYDNSIHRESNYISIAWVPLHYGNGRVGVMAGMTTGYDKFIPATPIASLYGSYEYKRFGVNVLWLPSIVVAVQLKWRVK